MLVIQESLALAGVAFVRLTGQPSDEELAAYLNSLRDRAKTTSSEESRVMVMELTNVWTSTQRKAMRNVDLEINAKSRAEQLGLAMVVPNKMIRGAFTAYFWVATPKYPTKMVPTANAGYEFVALCLEDAGRSAPSRESFEEAAASFWPAQKAEPSAGLVPLSAAEFRALVG